MSNYDYKIAAKVLSEVEKNRLVACYLNSNDTNAVNWKKAADDFGSASVDSFKKMIQNAFKKVKDAQEKAGNGEEVVNPASTNTKGRTRRKAADEVADDAEETPKPKAKRGRKAKKLTLDADGGDTGEGEAVVKAEGGDDE